MEKASMSGIQRYSQQDIKPCLSCKFHIPGKPFCSRFPDKKPMSIVRSELPCIYHRLLLNPVLSGMTGLAVGEAVGRSVRAQNREFLREHPPEEAFLQTFPGKTLPIGTALTLASIQGLLPRDLNITRVGDALAAWYRHEKESDRTIDFDDQDETQQSLDRFLIGWNPLKDEAADDPGTGSGSLMRMLPMAYYLKDETDMDRRRRIVYDASSLTHQSSRARIACFLFVELAIQLIHNSNIQEALLYFKKEIVPYCRTMLSMESMGVFERIFSGELVDCTEDEISSSGYAVDTLEAALWCLLHTGSYREAVLRAAGLGYASDAAAAVAGALAGIAYGFETIPAEWKQHIGGTLKIYNAACSLYRRTYEDSNKKRICSFLKKKYNLIDDEVEETYWYLHTQPDLCEEYLSCIRTGTFPSRDTIEVMGYNARKIYNETFLTQIGAYNFLVYLRISPERAIVELTAGMKRWRPVL